MRRKLKPVFIQLSDINRLCDIFVKASNSESNEYYKREANFEVINNNGQAYQFSVAEDFIEQLKNDIANIKDINFTYYGADIHLYLRFDSGIFSDIDLDIETIDKGTLLSYEDDFLKIFNKKSWNSIVRNIAFSVILSLILIAILSFISSKFMPDKVSDLIIKLLVTCWSFIGMGLVYVLRKFYPTLVLIDGDNCSGRVFKKDWWKFLGFLITLVIMPVLVNLVTK